MDRFLGVTSAYSATSNDGDELTEDDIFWTAADFTEQNHHHHQPPSTAPANSHNRRPSFSNSSGILQPPSTAPANSHNRRPSFSNSSGILAALTESNRYQILYRKAAAVPTIPRATPQEKREFNSTRKSKFQRQVQQSAPVNVPLLSMAVARERNKKFLEFDYYDEEGDGEMLPPHEIVARGCSGVAPKTTFSVLEGVGRTLKGRDLRQVRNAIWRKTGFLD